MTGPKIILIVGLPGSGKSTLSKVMADTLGIRDRPAEDDDFLRADLRPPVGLDGVIARLNAGGSCIVNDIALCHGAVRNQVASRLSAEAPGVEVQWYYLANDAIQCAVNVMADHLRGRRAMPRLEALRRFSAVYQPPDNVEVHPDPGVLPPPRKP